MNRNERGSMSKTFQLFIVHILIMLSVMFLHKDNQIATTAINPQMSAKKIIQVFKLEKGKKSSVSQKTTKVIIEESKEEIKVSPTEVIEEGKTVSTKKTESKILTYDIVGKKQSFDDTVFSDKYTEIDGVLTFRGNQYRSAPSYGTVDITEETIIKNWEFTTSTSSWGGGAGWTGQPAIVKWPEEIKKMMNLKPKYKQDKYFIEAIYASLDGNVYFFDLRTGQESREKIKIGNPIKGSISVDPRGYPLLYVGEGIPEKGAFGFGIYNLLDGKQLYHIKGNDKNAYRGWGAFDSSALIHGESDTLVLGGENGMLYLVSLNTKFDKEKKTISVEPEITNYRYKTSKRKLLGIENSVAAYKNLIYFADNSGYIQCFDMSKQHPVWIIDGKDDTDATLVLEVEGDTPYLYSGNEVDIQGTKGISEVKKINGLTGKIIWIKSFECQSQIGEHPVNGGMLGTPIIGKEKISDRIIINMARYMTFSGGLISALDKKTGDILWQTEMKNYPWSSPVDVYTKDGKAYIIQCNSAGEVNLINAENGDILHTIKLNANIESSPAIYKGFIVIATRGQKIYGLKIK